MNDKQKRLRFYKFLNWFLEVVIIILYFVIFGTAIVWLLGWV